MRNIDFECKPSLIYLLLFCTAGFLSIAIWISLPLSVWLKLAGLLASGYYLYPILITDVLLNSADSLIGLSQEREGWILFFPLAQKNAILCGETTATAGVSVVRFIVPSEAHKKTYVVFKDALSAPDYKRLLVKLRTSIIPV